VTAVSARDRRDLHPMTRKTGASWGPQIGKSKPISRESTRI